MADMKAYQELAGRQSLLEPAPVTSPTNATAKFLAERYAVGDAPTPSGFYGHYATDPNNAVVQRGILTPGAKYSDGKIHPAWPSFIHDAWEGYKAFADADPRDNSQEATDRLSKAAFDVSGLAMTGGLAAPRPAGSIGMAGRPRAPTGSPELMSRQESAAIPLGVKALEGGQSMKPKFDWGPRDTSGSRESKIGDTTITYGVNPKTKYADVILVKTPESKRGEGSARHAMQQMVNEADANGYTLSLTADPMGKGVSKPKLIAFYKSLGFKENTGRNKDFAVMAGMIRPPKR